MKQELVTVRNLDTGKVGKVRLRIAEHPVFGARLEIVDAMAKDLIPLTEVVESKRGKPTPVKDALEEAVDKEDK